MASAIRRLAGSSSQAGGSHECHRSSRREPRRGRRPRRYAPRDPGHPRVRRRPGQGSSTSGWAGGSTTTPPRWPGLRIVQFTPPGSGASITFGQGLTTAAPGSAVGGLVVSDIVAAHDEVAGRGIDASAIWHGPPFPVEARQPGPDPERASYGSFFSVADPDGNTWLVQEVTTRRPGRVAGDTAFASEDGPGRRAPAGRGRARRAREARRAVAPAAPVRPGRGLARLVRRLPGGGAGRDDLPG